MVTGRKPRESQREVPQREGSRPCWLSSYSTELLVLVLVPLDVELDESVFSLDGGSPGGMSGLGSGCDGRVGCGLSLGVVVDGSLGSFVAGRLFAAVCPLGCLLGAGSSPITVGGKSWLAFTIGSGEGRIRTSDSPFRTLLTM